MPKKKTNRKSGRKAKKTLLLYGEGSAEEVFLKHLRKLYAHRSGIAVTVRNGQGGAADVIVKKASICPGDFDMRVAVIDNDKGKKEMAQARTSAKERKLYLIENDPCLEAFLLRILNGGKVEQNKKSMYYKKEFERRHICRKNRCNSEEYVKVFPKKVLDAARKKVLELDRIIRFIEGKKIMHLL